MQKIDIHDRKHRLENLLTRIQTSDEILEKNKEKLFEYGEFLQANNLSLARREKILQTLYQLSKSIDKPFSKLDDKDVTQTFARINQEDWSDWTKHDFKIIFKKFYYKYLKGFDEYPLGLKLRVGVPNNNYKIKPESLLAIEEITKIASVTDKIRDKALVYVLYESGTRIGELLNMRIGDVHFDKFGALLDVTGKTGSRRVRIITSKQVLMDWINKHSLKDTDDPLWIDNKRKPLKYPACVRILKRLFEKAGVKKKFNPHLFRHSRATHLAKLNLNEAMLKKFFGWSDKSEMAAYYIHLSKSDVDNALLGLHGIDIKKEGKKLEKVFRTIICPACNRELTPDVKICPCGMIFDRTLTKRRIKGDRILDEMLDVEWFSEAFEKRLKEMGYKKS